MPLVIVLYVARRLADEEIRKLLEKKEPATELWRR